MNQQVGLISAPVDKSMQNHKHHVYLRVSTDKQDNQNQESGVLNYLEKEGISNYHITRENVSSVTPWRDRGLFLILSNCIVGDVIVVAEFSRIGRNTPDVLGFLEVCVKRGVTIYVVKSNLRIGDDATSQIMSTMLALISSIELGFIRSRTREAIARRKQELIDNGFFVSKKGEKRYSLGPPAGRIVPSSLEPKRAQIIELMAANVSYRSIAKLVGKNERTVAKFCKGIQL
jgi:DNA invertase Pin-like site-specific DNA recombinase